MASRFSWLTRRFRVLALSSLNLLIVSPVMAYCPRFQIAPNSEFFDSRFVVIGTVVSEQTKTDSEGFLESTTYLIKVEKTYRGSPRRFLKTHSENDSGRFEMDKGQTYLLFVGVSEDHLVVNNCGNSGRRSEARTIAALEAIARIGKSGPYGDIEGHIELATGFTANGIRVVATNGKKQFVAGIADDGSFQMRVPAGNYRFKVKSNGPAIIPYDLNIGNPDHFTIYSGGSVHFEYDAR